ncbi:4-hydroxythreonine-4-phosphate dehydrogenase PdxA [Paenibacillus sp. GCM10023252]|uniref:4-hydroxythreonine-4-phosphate dehydrogenase PdxA n=1 Tax=Paenibacillus sp. GCM10023252 TaxID=3252649 RepID=UPI00360C0312
MNVKRKPVIGITMGDPSGVGPEIIWKALASPEVHEQLTAVVIGDGAAMQRARKVITQAPELLNIAPSRLGEGISSTAAAVPIVDLGVFAEMDHVPPYGIRSAEAGDAAYRCIEEAVRLGMEGRIDAICTAPINKESLNLAGHHYPGHTELLAYLMGAGEVAMMLTAPGLRVIHVTTHCGLLEAIRRITPERVYEVIQLGHQVLRRSGITFPRIAVCGINPHAGEGGMFGEGEEAAQIEPAIHRALAEGIDVQGPLPADTLFYRARRGDYDLVVAMYHDQGHGPVKVLGLESGVNISVGLPILRTSVDHGTAFDIAGQGVADERSLIEALLQAAALTPQSGLEGVKP